MRNLGLNPYPANYIYRKESVDGGISYLLIDVR